MKRHEMIINYILSHFNSEPKKISKVKLAKILWFCEREYMYKYKTRLCADFEFIKLSYGPVPKKYEKILKDMEKQKIIHIFEIDDIQTHQVSFHSIKSPDLNDFTTQEIDVINSVIYELKDKSATELSKLSHDIFWKKTEMGNTIPVESVFAKDSVPPTSEDWQWALGVLESREKDANQSA